MPARGKIFPHKYETEEEIVYILKGRGQVGIDGAAEALDVGTVIHLPVGSEHHIENASDDVMRPTFASSPPVRIGSSG